MNRKITILLSLLILGFCFQSKGQAPITGPTTLCLGSTIALSSTDAGGTWTSSNTNVATIDLAGHTVTAYPAVAPLTDHSGTTVITYTSSAGVATRTVTVGTGPLSGPTTVCAGSSIALSSATAGGTWTSSNAAVASVNSVTGVVTGGTTTGPVTITLTNSCGSATHTITVVGVGPLSGPTAVCAGATITLSTATPGGTWSSSNATIASVDAVTGVVTGGTTPGIAVISFTNSCGFAQHNVKVGIGPISGAAFVCQAVNVTLSSATPGGTWTSSNTSIATIDPVTGVLTGGATAGPVTITLTNSCGSVTYAMTVGVGPITGPNAVCEGATITLSSPTAPGGTWSSLTSAIATIDAATGVVTGGATPGNATIAYGNTCGVPIYYNVVVTNVLTAISGLDEMCTGFNIYLSDAVAGGTWSSSNVAIASVVAVPPSGVRVYGGTTPGVVNITYSNVCTTVTHSITVKQSPGAVNGLNNFCQGSTAILTASPAGGTWSSGNTLTASVDPTGVITGSGVGSTCISYNMTNGCYSVYCVVVNNCPPCEPNSDFELGNYSVWKYYTGTCCPGGNIIATTPTTTPPAAGLIPSAFSLTGPTCGLGLVTTCGVDNFGGFPVVGAGVYSLRIGSGRSNQWASKAVYFVHVPSGPGAFSLIYQYAVVLENPPTGHDANSQPRFTVRAVDVTGVTDSINGGTVIPCANFKYVPSATGGGIAGWFGPVAGVPPVVGGSVNDVWYKPWATTSVNLTGLGGHIIRMEFASGGCNQTGHFAYGYVDMTCGTFAISSLGCGDSVATLTAPSGFANYAWFDSSTFGMTPPTTYGTTQTITLPMPTVPTTYAVIMTPFTGFGCPDTLYTRIRPSDLRFAPKADTLICAGETAKITVNATDVALPLTYQWTPVATLSCATCAEPIATPFAGTNVYTVIVTDDAGCSKTGYQTVRVDSVAAVTTATATACFGFSNGRADVTPTSGITPYTYVWSTVPAQTNSLATGLAVGVYTVIVTDSTNRCRTQVTATVTQPPLLSMSIAGSVNLDSCTVNNGKIQLAGLVPGGSFVVRYIVSAVPPSTAPTYTVTTGTLIADGTGILTISNLGEGKYDSISIVTSGCPYNKLGPVTISPPANPALPYVSSNSPVCVGNPLSLVTNHTDPLVTFTWSGPNVFTNTTQNPTIDPATLANDGWYVVDVMKNLCHSKDSTRVIITPNPMPRATNNTPICSESDTARLYGFDSLTTTGVDVYSWAGPGGFVSNFQNPVIPNAPITAAGIYTMTVTKNGCSKSDTTEVTIHETPAPPAVHDTNYCQGNPPIAISADGTNLIWYTNMSDVTGTTVAPVPNTDDPHISVWYVTQTSNTIPACKSGKAPLTVGVYALPDPKFSITDSVFCQGTFFTFTVQDENTGADYQGLTWSFGPDDSVRNTNPVLHSFDNGGTIEVGVNVNYAVCPDAYLRHNVVVIPYPSVHLGADTSICPGSESVSLWDYENTDPSTRWIWSTGETTKTINVVAPGTYYVKVTVNGCATSDTIVVANDCYMNMPNIFTPNGDGVNDFFYPRQFLTRGLTSFSMTIYNRWGQLVFTTNSIEGRGWDGRFNDVPQPEGVFIYVVDAAFKDGQKEHKQGNITLLR